MSEAQFQREERYIVVKLSRSSDAGIQVIRDMARSGAVAPVECVVVEDDWPEYETVWRMIETRCVAKAKAHVSA